MSIRESLREFFRNDSDARIAALLQAHMREIVSASRALALLFESPRLATKTKLAEIVRHEHRGDEHTKNLRTLLDEVFITKQLSKEHTSRLVSHLDDILDDMRDAARHVDTYAIDGATEEAKKLVDEIDAMVAILSALVEKQLVLSVAEVQEAYAKMKKHESSADQLRSEGVKAFASKFKNLASVYEKNETLYRLVAWKDIYAKLERVTDHCLHAVDEIAAMVRNY